MKKYGKIIKIAFNFLLQLFLFASCGNLTDSSSAAFTSESSSKTGTTVILNGTVSAQGAFPQAVIDSLESSEETESRAAIPAVPESAYYYLLATPDSGDTVSGDSKSGTFTVTEGTFALPLASGKTWNVEIGIKNSSDTVILSDSYSVTLTDDDPVILHTFVLQASSGGTGSVSLSMNVCNTVTKVTSSCADSGWTNNVTTSQTYITGSAIPSGTYEVTLNFYSSSDILLYSTVQNISVLSGMETDYWKNSASSSASLISNGKLELTQALITSFARSTFYIGNTSVGTASSSGNGSPYEPFESLTQALSAIAVTGSPSNDYRIFVNGTLTGINEISSSVNEKAKSITVSGLTGSSTDILNGNSEGTVLTVNTTVPVTIRKLKITGGSAANGGGLNIEAGAAVTLIDTSVVGNSATNGGGIYNKGTVFLSGSTIIGKSESGIATSTSYGNKATSSGAGIYGESGSTLYLGYTSSSDKSTLTGGVCKNYLANSSNATSQGGGIYSEGSIYFDSGNVSFNYAMNGSGIYAKSSVQMTGGIIEGNEGDSSNSSGGGAGIFVAGSSNTLTMSGDAEIKNNKNMALGAGVYLNYENCKLVMNGGTISSNVAVTNGGAVYMHDLNSNKHSYLQMYGSASIPSDGVAKQNDVYILDTNSVIEITGELTQTETIATITPKTYSTTVKVLSETEGSEFIKQYGKLFAVSKKDSETWAIDYIMNYGYLITTKTIDEQDYLEYKASSANSIINLFEKINDLEETETENIGIFFTSDIDISSDTDWEPINSFCGVIDGDGHTFKISDNKSDNFSAVCYENKGIIQNLKLEATDDISIEVYDESYQHHHNFGSFCVFNHGIIRNCWNTINCTSSKSFRDIGGICSINCKDGVIENCINTGKIQSEFKSGTTVSQWGGTYASAGGITGTFENNSDNDGTGGEIRNCVNYGEVELPKTYDTSSSVNGMAGAIAGNSFHDIDKIKNCYWLKNCVKSNEDVGTANDVTNLNWMICKTKNYPSANLRKGTFTSNGSFVSNGTLTAGTEEEVGTAQTLAYGNTLLSALNSYVSSDENLCEWKASTSYVAIPKIFE